MMAGCATTGQGHLTAQRDPFESVNRAVFRFNDSIDRVVLKKVAKVYKEEAPVGIQIGVGNFFGNLADVGTAANNVLQGKMADGLSDMMRVLVNSTFGLYGVLDIGSEAGLTKHREDFGQTLGVWGVQSGPYVMLPFLGPSTARDTISLPVDSLSDPWPYTTPAAWRNDGLVVRLVDKRAGLLDGAKLVEDAALDRYEFIRDAYLQRRRSLIYDGEVPESLDQEH